MTASTDIPPQTRPPARLAPWIIVLIVLFAATFSNTLLFASQSANPVVSSDAWSFVDSFVMKDVSEGWSPSDLFGKRSETDHAQPLNKLILSMHTHAFALDFWWEGIIGVIFAGIFAAALLLVATYSGHPVRGVDTLVVACIPIAVMSLNSTSIFAWPLVTLFFVSLPLLLAVQVMAANRGSWLAAAGVFGASAVSLLIQDNAALLGLCGIIGALLLRAWTEKGIRPVLPMLAAIVAAVAVTKLLQWSMLPPVPPGALPATDGVLAGLWRELANSWMWLMIPAASSLVHPSHLQSMIGEGYASWMCVLGVFVLMLHALFWKSALDTLNRTPTFVAVALMLTAYGLTAGIILARVPEYGSAYLHQHRYVAFYQLANVALLLQLTVVLARRRILDEAAEIPTGGVSLRIGGAILAFSFMALQIALTTSGWIELKYIRKYSEAMAATLRCLAVHPEYAAPSCQPLHTVCQFPIEKRNELVAFLSQHQLNVFSPAFQARHRMYPSPDDALACAPATP